MNRDYARRTLKNYAEDINRALIDQVNFTALDTEIVERHYFCGKYEETDGPSIERFLGEENNITKYPVSIETLKHFINNVNEIKYYLIKSIGSAIYKINGKHYEGQAECTVGGKKEDFCILARFFSTVEAGDKTVFKEVRIDITFKNKEIEKLFTEDNFNELLSACSNAKMDIQVFENPNIFVFNSEKMLATVAKTGLINCYSTLQHDCGDAIKAL